MFRAYKGTIALVIGLLFGQHSAQALQPEEVMQQFVAELQNAKQTEFGLAHSWIIGHIEKHIALDDSQLLEILTDLGIVYWSSSIIALNPFSQDTSTILIIPSLALLLSAIANDIADIQQLLESPCMPTTGIEKVIVLSAKYSAAAQAIQLLLNTGVKPYADNAKALFTLAHEKNIIVLRMFLDAAIAYATKLNVISDLEMQIRAVHFTFSQSIYKNDRLDILALLEHKHTQLITGNEQNPSKKHGCCTFI